MNPVISTATEETTKRKFTKRDRSDVVVRTLHFRIKDKHAKVLSQWAFEVNQVWNACNAWCAPEPIPEIGWWTPHINRINIREPAVACVKERGLKLHSQTVQIISNEYRLRRDKALKEVGKGKGKLKYRKSCGKERSLGWVPFCGQAIKLSQGKIRFNGHFWCMGFLRPGSIHLARWHLC